MKNVVSLLFFGGRKKKEEKKKKKKKRRKKKEERVYRQKNEKLMDILRQLAYIKSGSVIFMQSSWLMIEIFYY